MNGEIISRESIENGGDAEIITLNILGECRLIGRTSDGVHIYESSLPLAIYIIIAFLCRSAKDGGSLSPYITESSAYTCPQSRSVFVHFFVMLSAAR